MTRALEESYPWDQCIRDQTKRYGSKDTAEKVCGMIKSKYGESAVLPEPRLMLREVEEELWRASEMTWDQCMLKMDGEGYSQDQAERICGSICAGKESQVLEATIAPSGQASPQGRVWEVTIIGANDDRSNVQEIDGQLYIVSENGLPYAVEGIRASAPFWDGVAVFDNHLTDQEFKARGGMRSPGEEWAGTLVEPWWDADRLRLCSTLKIVDDGLATKLKSAHEQGVLQKRNIGLSIDTFPTYGRATHEGRQIKVAKGFERDRINSVDIVMKPAAGGGFDRLIAAQHTEDTMAFSEEQLNEIRAVVAEALAAQRQGTQEQDEAPPAMAEPAPESPEEAAAQVAQAAEEVATDAPPEAAPAEVAQAAANAAQDEADKIAAMESRLWTLELDKALGESKLPAEAAAIVREALGGKRVKKEQVSRMIESVRKVAARSDPSGQVQGAGTRSVGTVGMNADDWREVEFMRLLAGNYNFRRLESIEDEETKGRLAEAKGYQAWIKAGRPRGNTRRLSEWLIQGYGDPLERAFEAATTSSLSSVVKNTVNIMLAADFQQRNQWWKPIVREEEVDSIDTATLVRFFGLTTLDVVDEGQAYTELAMVDEEETAAFVKRGNYVGITMETLLADKVNKVRAIPQLLSDSWYNTHSKYVAAVFTSNSATGPVLADTGALFNATATSSAAGHANLLTSALSYTNYVAARVAMSKQTSGDSGSGVKLMIRPKFLLVPTDLEAAAKQIIGSELIPGSANNDINPYQNECEIITVPEWTDTNDWALVGDPAQFPAIYVLYYRGNRVPELYTSEDETQGAMFTNDTLRFKVRMLTFRYSSTYDCAPVADFRPLHKSNVT